jgi:hypothetical protein
LDSIGAVLPGVTVTATSPSLIGVQTTVSRIAVASPLIGQFSPRRFFTVGVVTHLLGLTGEQTLWCSC